MAYVADVRQAIRFVHSDVGPDGTLPGLCTPKVQLIIIVNEIMKLHIRLTFVRELILCYQSSEKLF